MTPHERFDAAMAACPLIAILRGVEPDEVVAIGEELVAAGFGLIEVPLNSPQPLESVTRLAEAIGDRVLIGAGTVVDAGLVKQVRDSGGQMIISPNFDPAVVIATKAAGLVSLPGIMTPSEAFGAVAAGADALKLFPADSLGPATLRALRSVLPVGTRILAVGGVTPGSVGDWLDAGAAGFGIGGALYRPGMTAGEVGKVARESVAALRR